MYRKAAIENVEFANIAENSKLLYAYLLKAIVFAILAIADAIERHK